MTTKPQHTPTPWYAIRGTDKNGEDAGFWHIDHTSTDYGRGSIATTWSNNSGANARRIVFCVNACAPDGEVTRVLERTITAATSLSDILHRLEERGVDLPPWADRDWAQATGMIEDARAALAKLRGEG